MSELTEDVFKNRDVLPKEELTKYVIGGIEKIKDDLLRYQDYDGTTPVACVAIEVRSGDVH